MEEGEAWFLGDISAIKKAYPKAKNSILNRYQNDSVCDTWELLADAIFAGGSSRFKKRGWQTVGIEKSAWAEKITLYMDVDKTNLPVFVTFEIRSEN